VAGSLERQLQLTLVVRTLARIGLLAAVFAITGFAWWRVHHRRAALQAAPVVTSAPQVKRGWGVTIDPNRIRLVDPIPDPNAGRPRFGECAVYVDGQPMAVLRYGELPPNLPIHWQKIQGEDGEERFPQFLMAEYLEGIGVNVRKVRELHLYGGQERIAIVKGDELRKFARKFYFSFTRATTGKPFMRSLAKGFHISDYVDTFSTVAVYIDKPAPRWSDEAQGLVDDDGRDIEGVPYVKTEMRGGTRVYVDAKLSSNIKRNLLSSNMATRQDASGKPIYSLDAFLKAQKVELPRIHTIELALQDRVVLSVRPDQLKGPIEFETITDSTGTELFHVSKIDGDSHIQASVVRLYSKPHNALALR
jgi:hypothetical protein